MKVVKVTDKNAICNSCGEPLNGKKALEIMGPIQLCIECTLKQFKKRTEKWTSVLLELTDKNPDCGFCGYDENAQRILYSINEEDAREAAMEEFGIEKDLTDKELQKIQRELNRGMEYSWHQILCNAIQETMEASNETENSS